MRFGWLNELLGRHLGVLDVVPKMLVDDWDVVNEEESEVGSEDMEFVSERGVLRM